MTCATGCWSSPPGGRIAFYGPPRDSLRFFGFRHWPEAFEAFENDTARNWAGDYAASAEYRRYVAAATEQPHLGGAGAPAPAPEPANAQSWGAQLWTLMRRYVAALTSDRTFLAIMIALPFVMGGMTRVLAGHKLTADSVTSALLVLCVGGVLTGAANAVRELVKERVIYQRERAVGLSRSAYVMSKVLVLGLITVAQAVVLTLVALAGVDTSAPGGKGVFLPPLAEIALAMALLGFTAMMMGLVVSAVVRKEEVTMPLLVLIAIVQVVFCGAQLQLHGRLGLEQLSWLVPSRWALAAMAGTIDLHHISPIQQYADPLFHHSAAVWLLDAGMLVLLSAVLGLLVARLLRRHEPAVMRK
ncbi:hypothetical protein GCM10020000_72800 [Streptomyces olivoverticillatus]